MSDSKLCPSCGHANTIDARFCGKCGTPLAQVPVTPAAPAPAPVAPAPVAPAPAARDANRTMLGAMLEPPPAAAAPPVAARSPNPNRTVVGGGFEGLAEFARSVQAAAQAGQPLPTQPAQPPMQPPMPPPTPAAPQVPAAIAQAPLGATVSYNPAPASIPVDAPLSQTVNDPQPPLHFAAAAPLPTPSPPPASSAKGLPPSPMAAVEPREPTPAAPTARKDLLRTMMGVGLDAVPPAAPIAPAAAPAHAHAPVAPAASPSPMMASPMMAPAATEPVASPPAQAAPAAAAPAPAPAAAKGRANRTMLGMPTPLVAPGASEAAAPAPAALSPAMSAPAPSHEPAPPSAPAPAAPGPTVADAPQPKRAVGPSHRTMLGVAAPVLAAARASAAAPAPAPVDAPAPAPMMSPQATAATTTTGDLSIAGLPSPRRRARGWFFALLFVGVALVGSVIAAGLYYRFTRSRVEVTAAVDTSDAGEVLRVDVTPAPDGARVHFGNAEQPVAGGHASFPLAADALHVGDNALALVVVLPDGTQEAHSVTLTVEYRVRADLATLAPAAGSTAPPAITVVVDAIPGSTVVLDAQPVTLDAAGHGTRAYPLASLAPNAEGVIELTAQYTISPPAPAAPAPGTLHVRVPTTTVQIDRPSDGAVTDQRTLVIAGAVQPGATVSIEGQPATVTPDGHFNVTLPLAEDGEHELHVVASAAGRAPTTRVIHVRRVADLAREAASFTIDRTLTYARIVADPTVTQGAHVAIEGRVYNVDLQDGHGVLQMLARDCAAGERCPLWVTYPAVGEVAVESWVRVVGTVAGTQQFRSQSGEVRTVPRVDAAFVLPSHP